MLYKTRYKCCHCKKTFTAQTDVVDEHCFISNTVKTSIIDDATTTKNERMIASENFVSESTVHRRIDLSAKDIKVNPYNSLPENLSMDEFNGVKNTTTALSAMIIDNNTHNIIDILEDRTIRNLSAYFMRFDRQARLQVKTFTIDMYEPYERLIRELFPNAAIIYDRFHIVQHLVREFTKLRVSVMNERKPIRHNDYTVIKNNHKLLIIPQEKLTSFEYYWNRSLRTYTTTRDVVEHILKMDERLRRSYNVLQRARKALEDNNYTKFMEILASVERKDVSSGIWKVIRLYQRKSEIIKNTMDYPQYTNAGIEGINNKIKLIKRNSYGYRNFSHLRARIFLIFKLTKRENKKDDCVV